MANFVKNKDLNQPSKFQHLKRLTFYVKNNVSYYILCKIFSIILYLRKKYIYDSKAIDFKLLEQELCNHVPKTPQQGLIVMERKYLLNSSMSVNINNETILSAEEVLKGILLFNEKILGLDNAVKDFDLNIFSILGLRNLSGMMGEVFARCIQEVSNDKLQSNLHQDGYPDLLLTNNAEKKEYFDSLYTIQNGKKAPKRKEDFSPFKYGGVEIKATCGSTPTASTATKPGIGDQRISVLCSFDWKAHHRETNNLLAILWDFIEGLPVIVGCFYCNALVIDDWGKIVQPKKDGGRTTSVSIMTAGGVKKMCKGWVAILDDIKYTEKLSNPKWVGQNIPSMKRKD